MSRKNRPQQQQPHDAAADTEVPIEEVPIEDTIEVGSVVLVEDPISGDVAVGTVLMVEDTVVGSILAEDVLGEDILLEETFDTPLNADLGGFADFSDPTYSEVMPAETSVDFGAADAAQTPVGQAQDVVGQVQVPVQDKVQDMAQNVTQTAQDLAGKAQGTAQDLAGKAQDVAQTAADKAKDAGQKIADKAAAVKTTAASAGSNSKSVIAGAAGTVGTSLWSLIQRNPLQAILFLSSLVWLVRNNKATASQPAVSVSDAAGDAAEKVGTVAGQVQVAASNLGSQVQEQGQRGAGWFSRTLQSNPLAIGTMGVVAGLGLGFAVPETKYENKALGKTRDQLLDKAQEAATDLTQKVTTVAQTAVHDAIEGGKAEAKNQGLTPQDVAAAVQAPQEQNQQQ